MDTNECIGVEFGSDDIGDFCVLWNGCCDMQHLDTTYSQYVPTSTTTCGAFSLSAPGTPPVPPSNPPPSPTTPAPPRLPPLSPPSLPPAWPPIGTLHVDATHRSWADAQAHCVLHGGRLVSVYSAEQMSAVRAAVIAAGWTDHVWLGGSDVASEGMWTWTEGVQFSNGATAVHGAYVDWCATAHRLRTPANAAFRFSAVSPRVLMSHRAQVLREP